MPTEGQPSQKDKEALSFLERDQKIKDTRYALLFSAGFPKEKVEEIWNEITNRVKYLKHKYKDHKNHAVFQALVGSTIRGVASSINEDDFPGEDSVVKFVEDLEKRYLK